MIRALQTVLAIVLLGAFVQADPIVLTKRERDQLKKETVYAIDLIQRYHYKQKSFSDIDSKQLLTEYIDDLDSARLFFLQEDVDFILERFEGSLKPSYLYVGDLYPAFEIFNIYSKRVNERLDWIDERLEKPFDFESDRTFLTDREDVAWPASMEEADELWDKRLTNDLILEILDDETMERAVEKITKRYDRMQKWVDEIEIHNVQETFLTSLAQLYDPHSNFFSWDSAQEFDIQISNALVGIGAQLRDVDGYCVIERLLPGGPAEMSGKLHPGDKIIEVAQGESEPVDVVDMKLRKIVQQIRGETGTEVRLTVIPAHSAKRKYVTLIREKVELTANLASAELFEVPGKNDSMNRIGVIDLPSFYGEGTFGEGSISTSRDVRELIDKLKDQQVDGIVLDLRNNGGGRLDEAVKLAGLFISEGPVVMKRTFNGEIQEDWDRNEDVAWNGPLVVLVSRSSASASEIVAGALQSLDRAVIVGDESTHGKGTVQAPIDLRSTMRNLPFSDSLEVGTVKITIQQFYLPNGESTQNRGVLADIPLPSANMFLMEGEADLDHALSWDEITPIEYHLPELGNPEYAFIQNGLKDQLLVRSQARQDKLEEFNFLNESVAWYKDRHEQKTVSLNIEKRRIEKDELEAKRDYFEDERNRLSESLAYEVKDVDLQITEEKEKAHQEKLRSTPLPNGEERANHFYQKVFYYEEPTDGKIHEVWVEYFDYDKALDHVEAIAELLAKESSVEITIDQATDILTQLKNKDRISDFDILDPFKSVLGDQVDNHALLDAMPAFFMKMVEIDPDILLERPKLDIPLREGLRIVTDWLDLELPLNPTKVASSIASKEEPSEETAATP